MAHAGGPQVNGNSNPAKRPLQESPTQQPQGGFPSDSTASRTIYTSFEPAFATNGAMNGNQLDGGDDHDSFTTNGLYGGQRAAGPMGRQPSGDAAPGSMASTSPQGQPRKRLRRGGPTPNDDTGDEGPGSFTDSLQHRLADVHVKSEAGSEASSAVGSASASMAPTPSYPGSVAGGDVKPDAKMSMSDSTSAVRQGVYVGSPLVQGSPGRYAVPSPQLAGQPTAGPYSLHTQYSQPQQQNPPTPPVAQMQLENPAFQDFLRKVGNSFPPEKCWQAFSKHPTDFNSALAVLVGAKPLGAPGGTMAPSYAAVNPPVASPAPGTPGAIPPQYGGANPQYAGVAQKTHSQQQTPQALHPAYPGQIPGQVRIAPGQPYPQQVARAPNGMSMHAQAVGTPQGAAALQQQQQAISYSQQQQAIAWQQRQAMAPQGQPMTPQQMQQRGYGPAVTPQHHPAAAYQFPPAFTGVAGMTDAHVRHYDQLQKHWRAGTISQADFKVLQQYINVLAQADQKRRGGPGYPPGYGQPAMYSHQGVYAGGQQGQMRMQQQQQRPKPVPKAVAPATSGSILARQLALANATASSASKKHKVKKRAYASDSDDDGGDYDSAGSGDEYGTRENPAMVARREALAVEFFNDCTKENLMELAGCNATQATLTMKLRPFASANDFRTRTRKQKGVGNNMMDVYLDVVTGMGEVDKVLDECEQIGRQLSSVMQIWASGAAVSAKSEQGKPGASGSNEVGMDLVAISEETIATRVDTSNDPRVREAFKDYIRRQPAGVPESIKLKDYQMLGVNWLNLLYRRGTSCILADEMGLGKTAQVIALLAHLKATGEPGPHLIIVPSSVLDNWMREFSIFAPDLKVATYYGSQAERHELRSELRKMEELDAVVTTYNIATGSPDDQKFLKRKMDFKASLRPSVTVFDEGHQLKNSESKKYKDLMQVRAQWRLLLTGTPLQNNLQELVSLLSFILPDQFRDANESLRAIFKVQPGSQTNLLSRERILRAKKMMTPFVLRRKKAQVLTELPNKTERIEYCEMTELQRECYSEALQRSRKALIDTEDDEFEVVASEDDEEAVVDAAAAGDNEDKPKRTRKKAVAAPSTKMGNKANTSSSAHILTDLRKASNHPMLFRRLYDEKKLKAMARDCLREEEFFDRNKDLIFEDMEVMTDFELHRFCQMYKHLNKYALKENEWMQAGKIAKLQEMLPDMKKKGDRVLIFSQFTQVLDILEVVLDTMELKYLKLTGQTAVGERQGLVDAYNNNEDITVFLLSTRAGGLGLNLTAANTVIFYDCDYNPHNDKQAMDRAYRLGQTRDVSVIRLITRGSLDEDMYRLATAKLKLDAEVSGQTSSITAGEKKPEEEEEETGGAEKKMKKSLLSGLKRQFELETQGGGATQAEVTQQEKGQDA
ncbi:ATP-dependent helicase fft2 [Rhodotorula toruloides]|nr:ATP-dependent helicase fft2 [Rhodotorula toruloides]